MVTTNHDSDNCTITSNGTIIAVVIGYVYYMPYMVRLPRGPSLPYIRFRAGAWRPLLLYGVQWRCRVAFYNAAMRRRYAPEYGLLNRPTEFIEYFAAKS